MRGKRSDGCDMAPEPGRPMVQPLHLHRLLQDVLRRDVDLGNDEEDGNLREREEGGREGREDKQTKSPATS